ncbi:MAG TPA: hypothetical protein DCE42_06430 [Myxococcales bacterium]|nr:hypothetical protein [Myxococcales bacterium]
MKTIIQRVCLPLFYCFALLAIVNCGPPELKLAIQSPIAIQPAHVVRMRIVPLSVLQGGDSQALAGLQKVVGKAEAGVSLDALSFDCDSLLKSIKNQPTNLYPDTAAFLLVELFEDTQKEADGVSAPIASGHAPLNVACQTLAARVVLSAPGSLTSWRVGGKELALPRVGHSVTSLPDGSLLISGGAQQIAFDLANGLFGITKSGTAAKTLLYSPSTDTYTELEALDTVFHSATLLGSQVLLLGGQTLDGKIASSNIVNYNNNEQTWQLSTPQETTETFFQKVDQRVLALRPAADANRLLFPVGGVCVGRAISECAKEEAQIRLFTASALEGADKVSQGVVLAGGLAYSTAETAFVTNKHLWYFSMADISGGNIQISASGSNAFALQKPRAGHSVSVLDKDNVLVVGGAYAQKGTSNLEFRELHNTAELCSRAGGKWDCRLLTDADFYSDVTFRSSGARVQHTATKLLDNRIVFVGGYSKLTGGPPAFNNDVLLLQYTKQDNTFTFCLQRLESGNPLAKRAWHTSTLLTTGQLLFVGGIENGDTSGSFKAVEPVGLFHPPPAISSLSAETCKAK